MKRFIYLALCCFLLSSGACASQQAEPKPEETKNPEDTEDKNETPGAGKFYQVDKHYDAASETWYFLTRIYHKDSQGKLIKLRHANSNKDVGEAVRKFAIRMETDLAFNASMGYLTGKNQAGEDTRKAVGIQIVEGKVLQRRKTKVYTLGIHDDNRLVAYPPGTQPETILEDGVQNALTAFIPLIQDGKPVGQKTLDMVGNMSVKHPRQVVGQFSNLDLLFLSCGGRGFDGKGMTAKEVISILEEQGVEFAFMLDGGGSVSTVIGERLITPKIDNKGTKERLRPNFLYIKHDFD